MSKAEKKVNNFNAECKIFVAQANKGKPIKRASAAVLVDAKCGEIVRFNKFQGIVSEKQARLSTLIAALKQARRLKKDKIDIVVRGQEISQFLESKKNSRSKDQELVELRKNIEKFRYYRIIDPSSKDEVFTDAVEFAKQAFRKRKVIK